MMRSLLPLLFLLNLLSTIALATPLPHNADYTPSIQTLYQFPQGTWLENLAVRCNNRILVTKLDKPELWEIDVSVTPALAKPIHTHFGDSTGLLGITEIARDEFAIVASNFSLATASVVPGLNAVWHVNLRNEKQNAQVSKLAQIPDAGLLNGITTLNANTVIIADSTKGVVWYLDTYSGQYEVVIDDPSMKPPDTPPFIGVNGIQIRERWLYFTNFGKQTLYRVPIDLKSGKMVGEVEVIASGFFMDDFALGKDETEYVTGNPANIVVKVAKDGSTDVIAGNLNSSEVAGATAAQFGRKGREKRKLYVTTSGALGGPVNGTFTEGGKLVAIQVDD